MEQIEVSKQLFDKSCEVFKAIVKPTESCERVKTGCGAYPYTYTLGREGGKIV